MTESTIRVNAASPVQPATEPDTPPPIPTSGAPATSFRPLAAPSGAARLVRFDPLAPRGEPGRSVAPRAPVILPPQEGDPWGLGLRDLQGLRIDEWGKRDTHMLKAHFPPRYAEMVASHVEHMFERGWAEHLDRHGLFHGHLLFSRELPEVFNSPTDLLDHTELMLYHTAEFRSRWNAESHLPLSERTPRSIVGRRDGSVIPAIDLMPPGFESSNDINYTGWGTLGSGDIESTDRERFFGTVRGIEPPMQSLGHEWQVSTTFLIRPDPNGRFTQNGLRYDVYLSAEPLEGSCGGCPVCAASCQ